MEVFPKQGLFNRGGILGYRKVVHELSRIAGAPRLPQKLIPTSRGFETFELDDDSRGAGFDSEREIGGCRSRKFRTAHGGSR